MIEVAGLSKQYLVDAGRVAALHDVTLKVGTGERLGLCGPSGSGKTTLLRCIAGLEAPEAGLIRIGGVEVYNARTGLNLAPWSRPIGVVFQDYALWPHMRVFENVMFPLRYGRANGLDEVQRKELALDALRKVRLEEFFGRFPSELSGGQRQRVALARALVSRPSVLLMDEPLSSLDPHLRKQTRNELVEVLERARITTVFVSHDHADGLFMTNLVGIMRDGRLVQVGSPLDVFLHPRDASVAQALDVGVVFACERIGSGADARYRLEGSNLSVQVPSGVDSLDHGSHALMLIPGDACSIFRGVAHEGNQQRLTGEVIREGYTGRGWCVLVCIAGVTVEVWERFRPGVAHGEVIDVAVNVERVRIIPAAAASPGERISSKGP